MQLPLFSIDSNWAPSKNFPNLSGVKKIGLDIEAKDLYLGSRGPGFIRGDAEVVGIACATEDQAWYFPFGHQGGGNLDKERVIKFFIDILKNPELYVIGANLQYDLEGLDSLGIQVRGRLIDVQIAEPLIYEESRNYSLDSLCKKYLDQGKNEKLLIEAAQAYGVDPKSGLWKLHSKYVGSYAEFDAISPIMIFEKQLPILTQEGLVDIFKMESELLPLLWMMRKNGIPVDVEMARAYNEELLELEENLRKKFKQEYGRTIDEWSGPMIAKLCEDFNIAFPRTEKGNPSFIGDFLEKSGHKPLEDIAKIREVNRLRSTYVQDWILKNAINEKVHPQWRQLAGDEGGTRTGRMAAANPNPQQIPSRGNFAEKLRSLFRHKMWAKLDYSQQEPRLLIHYAYLCELTGAKEIREAYLNDKGIDIYQFLAKSTGMTRRDSKDATLGRCYGMGAAKFAQKQGISLEEAKQKLQEFDSKVPFIKELSDLCMNQAQQRGYIRTLLRRRRHFNLWEPHNGGDGRALELELAKQCWPNQPLKRAHTYKALNALIQGSAADMTKAAMLLVYQKTGKVPFMAIHDELNYGVASIDEAIEIQRLCETCVEITVPIKADLTYGEHWK